MKWIEKYELLMNEEINTKQIMKILGKKHSIAKGIREDIVANASLNNIVLDCSNKIPTDLFLKHIGKDMKYFEQKMNQEVKLLNAKSNLKKERINK